MMFLDNKYNFLMFCLCLLFLIKNEFYTPLLHGGLQFLISLLMSKLKLSLLRFIFKAQTQFGSIN